MPKITVTVSGNGVMTLDFNGFQTKGCDLMENQILQKIKQGMDVMKLREDRKDQMVGESLHV